MYGSFKSVLEKEKEAERIITEAIEKADKLVNKAKEQGEELYKKTYQEKIDLGKIESEKFKQKVKKEAEIEAQIFLEQANELKQKIQTKANKNFENAVELALQEILS